MSSLARECADASVLPVVGAAILTFVACTAGSSWLSLSVPAIVLGSLAASALYAFALAHARRIGAELPSAIRARDLGARLERVRVDDALDAR
jgi:hypothetical protein